MKEGLFFKQIFSIQHQMQKISVEWLKFNLYTIQQPIETKLQFVFKKSTQIGAKCILFPLFSYL